MKAIRVIAGAASFDPRAPEPVAGAKEAIVRVLAAAVTGADLAHVAGEGGYSGIPGSRFVGIVERAGVESGVREGARVVCSPRVPCGACDLCRAGLSNHCREVVVIGGPGRDGCYAERVAAPAANLVEVPRSIDDDGAILAYDLALAVHAASMVRSELRAFVSVVGDSPVALLCAQVLSAEAPSVRWLGKDPRAIELCTRWGLRHRPESDAGRRADQGAVIDAGRLEEGLSLSLRLARPRGTVVVCDRGAPGPGWSPEDAALITERELTVVGARDIRLTEAVALLARGRVRTEGLISRRITLDEGHAGVRSCAGESLRAVMRS